MYVYVNLIAMCLFITNILCNQYPKKQAVIKEGEKTTGYTNIRTKRSFGISQNGILVDYADSDMPLTKDEQRRHIFDTLDIKPQVTSYRRNFRRHSSDDDDDDDDDDERSRDGNDDDDDDEEYERRRLKMNKRGRNTDLEKHQMMVIMEQSRRMFEMMRQRSMDQDRYSKGMLRMREMSKGNLQHNLMQNDLGRTANINNIGNPAIPHTSQAQYTSGNNGNPAIPHTSQVQYTPDKNIELNDIHDELGQLGQVVKERYPNKGLGYNVQSNDKILDLEQRAQRLNSNLYQKDLNEEIGRKLSSAMLPLIPGSATEMNNNLVRQNSRIQELTQHADQIKNIQFENDLNAKISSKLKNLNELNEKISRKLSNLNESPLQAIYPRPNAMNANNDPAPQINDFLYQNELNEKVGSQLKNLNGPSSLQSAYVQSNPRSLDLDQQAQQIKNMQYQDDANQEIRKKLTELNGPSSEPVQGYVQVATNLARSITDPGNRLSAYSVPQKEALKRYDLPYGKHIDLPNEFQLGPTIIGNVAASNYLHNDELLGQNEADTTTNIQQYFGNSNANANAMDFSGRTNLAAKELYNEFVSKDNSLYNPLVNYGSMRNDEILGNWQTQPASFRHNINHKKNTPNRKKNPKHPKHDKISLEKMLKQISNLQTSIVDNVAKKTESASLHNVTHVLPEFNKTRSNASYNTPITNASSSTIATNRRDKALLAYSLRENIKQNYLTYKKLVKEFRQESKSIGGGQTLADGTTMKNVTELPRQGKVLPNDQALVLNISSTNQTEVLHNISKINTNNQSEIATTLKSIHNSSDPVNATKRTGVHDIEKSVTVNDSGSTSKYQSYLNASRHIPPAKGESHIEKYDAANIKNASNKQYKKQENLNYNQLVKNLKQESTSIGKLNQHSEDIAITAPLTNEISSAKQNMGIRSQVVPNKSTWVVSIDSANDTM